MFVAARLLHGTNFKGGFISGGVSGGAGFLAAVVGLAKAGPTAG
jgi:hypothetical protein